MKIKTLNFIGLIVWTIITCVYLFTVYNNLNENKLEKIKYNKIVDLKMKTQDLLLLSNELFHNNNERNHELWIKNQSLIEDKIIELLAIYKNQSLITSIKKLQDLNENMKIYYQNYLKTDILNNSENLLSFKQLQATTIFATNAKMVKLVINLNNSNYKKLELLNEKVSYNFIFFSLIVFLFVTLIFIFIRKKVLTPHELLIKNMEKYLNHDYSKKIDIDSNDEIGEFANTFNKIINKINKWEKNTKELNEKNMYEIKQRLKTKFLYQAIMNNINDAIVLMDKNYNIILANEKFLNLFKLDKNYKNKNLKTIFSINFADESHIERWIWIEDRKAYLDINFNDFFETKDTTKTSGIIATIRENTEKKLLEDENKKQEQLLIQQSKLASMGEMIGAIAHQWRQPLSAIGGTLINIEEAFEYNELTKEYLSKQLDSSEKNLLYMSKTIDDFRNFFSPSKSKIDFCIKKSLADALSIVKAQLHDNFIDIKISFEKEKNININDEKNLEDKYLINGYPNEFVQVLVNIFANAKDAINTSVKEKKLIEGDGFIFINLYSKDGYINLEIEDNGGGIPKDIINRIFEPYFTTKDEGNGTGIGLYMSKMICEKNMNSQLSVINGSCGAIFKIKTKRVIYDR